MMTKSLNLLKALSGIAASLICLSCQNDPRSADAASTAETWLATKAEREGNDKSAETHFASAVSKAEDSDNLLQLPLVLQQSADLYAREKKYTQAEACLRRAVERYQAMIGGNPAKVADRTAVSRGSVRSLASLAEVLTLQGKLNEAQEFYKQALTLNKESAGSVDLTLSISCAYIKLLREMHHDAEADLMQSELRISNLTEAEVAAGIEKEIILLNQGKDDPSSLQKLKALMSAAAKFPGNNLVQKSQHYLALALFKHSEPGEALSNFEQSAQALDPKQTGEGCYESYDENLAAAVAGQACCLDIQGKSRQADQLYHRALHLNVKATYDTIAQVMLMSWESGNTSFAQHCCDLVCRFADEDKAYCQGHLEQIVGLINGLANHYDFEGKPAQAELMHESVLTLLDKNKAKCTRVVAEAVRALGQDYGKSGKYAKADVVLQRALSMSNALDGPGSGASLNILRLLGDNCLAQRKFARAENYYKTALSLYAKSDKTESEGALTQLQAMADFYEGQQRFVDAGKIRERMIPGIEKSKGLESLTLAGCLNGLANDYRHQGRDNDAERLYRRSVKIVERANGARSAQMASTLNQFADMYQESGRYSDAAPLYRRALEIYRLFKKEDSREVKSVLACLAIDEKKK